MTAASSYCSQSFESAIRALGDVVRLPKSRALLRRREIPGSESADLMSPYPQLSMSDWTALADDLDDISGDAVSLVACIDPSDIEVHGESIRRAFPARLRAFKRCFRIDLDGDVWSRVRQGHRRKCRRASRAFDTLVVSAGSVLSRKAWPVLLEALSRRPGFQPRHQMGMEALSHVLSVPGAISVLASERDVVSGQLWLPHGDGMVSHWVASTEAGRSAEASYATHGTAVDYFRDKVAWLQLGGGIQNGGAGLEQFKRGWSDRVEQYWLAGRVLRSDCYRQLADGRSDEDWFPAYRAPAS